MLNSSLFWIYWFLGDGLLNTCYSKCDPQSWSISIKWELVRNAELCPHPRPTESESSLLQGSQVNWVHIIIWEALDYRHLSESFPVQTLSFAFSLESHYDSCRIILVLPRTVAPWYTEFCKIAGEIVPVQLRFFMSLWKLKRSIIYSFCSHTKTLTLIL